MREVDRIADQLRRSFHGPAWHGPAVMDVLADVTAPQAAARPIAHAHTIWEIALHLTTWNRGVLRRLQGDRADLPPEQDWPAVGDTSEASWDALRRLMMSNHTALHTAVVELSDARLDEPILDEMSSVYVTLHGVVQHDLYHAGQMAILKKA